MSSQQQVKVVAFAFDGDHDRDAAIASAHRLAEQVGEVALSPTPLRHLRWATVPADVEPGLDGELLTRFQIDASPAVVELTWFDRDNDGARPAGQAVGDATPPVLAGIEQVVFERALPTMTLVAFVHRVQGVTRASFHRSYHGLGEKLREMRGPAELCCRYAQTHALGEREGPDAVGELGFVDSLRMREFLLSPWLVQELIPFEATFLDHSRTITALARWTA
jgi:hypothetical protein